MHDKLHNDFLCDDEAYPAPRGMALPDADCYVQFNNVPLEVRAAELVEANRIPANWQKAR